MRTRPEMIAVGGSLLDLGGEVIPEQLSDQIDKLGRLACASEIL